MGHGGHRYRSVRSQAAMGANDPDQLLGPDSRRCHRLERQPQPIEDPERGCWEVVAWTGGSLNHGERQGSQSHGQLSAGRRQPPWGTATRRGTGSERNARFKGCFVSSAESAIRGFGGNVPLAKAQASTDNQSLQERSTRTSTPSLASTLRFVTPKILANRTEHPGEHGCHGGGMQLARPPHQKPLRLQP